MHWGLGIRTRLGVSISALRISKPSPLVRISRKPRYQYYWVSVSVQGFGIGTRGLGIGIVSES